MHFKAVLTRKSSDVYPLPLHMEHLESSTSPVPVQLSQALAGSSSSSCSSNADCSPIQMREIPNTTRIDCTQYSATENAKKNTSRKTTAPTIPHISAVWKHSLGVEYTRNTRWNTNRLSTLRKYSIRYPLNHMTAVSISYKAQTIKLKTSPMRIQNPISLPAWPSSIFSPLGDRKNLASTTTSTPRHRKNANQPQVFRGLKKLRFSMAFSASGGFRNMSSNTSCRTIQLTNSVAGSAVDGPAIGATLSPPTIAACWTAAAPTSCKIANMTPAQRLSISKK
mmetsp:Transcript_24375/g.59136  ORF Transcript_24375/g.59136 Transcript_24375/m.59136 type:complete len:280 (-) Transcript_24375:31-870(-)